MTASVDAQDDFQPGRLAARHQARPLKVVDERADDRSLVVRDDLVRRTSAQEDGLRWSRRGDQGPALGAPLNADSAPRIAAADPIDDPFGDRQGDGFGARDNRQVTPISSRRALQESTAPLDDPMPMPAEPGVGGPGVPRTLVPQDRSGRFDVERVFDCERFYNQLAGDTIKSIELRVAPTFHPEFDAAQRSARLERIIADQADRDWIDLSGRVIARGRVVDWTRDGTVVLRDVDGQDVRVFFHELSPSSRRDVAYAWEVPAECALPEVGPVDRLWVPQTYTWTASALCHKPLFFEDVQLERYGQTAGPIIQPFKSGAHFFLNIAAMPYNAGVYPANECRYALGYYRPGDCAPYLGKSLPLSARGALFQAGAVVGAASVLP